MNDVTAQKRPSSETTAFSPESTADFQTTFNVSLLSITFLFEDCQNFHQDMTGFAMQMQVTCFQISPAPFFYVSHQKEIFIQIRLKALVDPLPDVFMYPHNPQAIADRDLVKISTGNP